jgi:FkbM family methyltransferase
MNPGSTYTRGLVSYMERNINFYDRLKGTPAFGYRIAKSMFDYYLASYLILDNWYDAMLIRGGMNGKKKLRFRQRSIDNTISGSIVHSLVHFDYDRTSGRNITLRYKGRPLVLHCASDYQLTNTITGIKEQFVEDQYKDVDVNGRTVLDIGASIGDSALYFAMNGAKKVIALEPYPYTYKVAKANVRLNKLQNRVTVLNEACRAKPGTLLIDQNFQNNDRNSLKYFKDGKRINMTTLSLLAKKYGLKDAVLKVDCEGYEYEIIDSASTELLRKFKTIVMEFHYGSRSLETKLRKAGFNVRCSVPFYVRKIDDKVDVLCGFLYAERV